MTNMVDTMRFFVNKLRILMQQSMDYILLAKGYLIFVAIRHVSSIKYWLEWHAHGYTVGDNTRNPSYNVGWAT